MGLWRRQKLPESVALLCSARLQAVSQDHSGRLPNFPLAYFDQYHVSTALIYSVMYMADAICFELFQELVSSEQAGISHIPLHFSTAMHKVRLKDRLL